MLVPYSTDAPIYHWPLATVGLVVTNVLVFVGLSAMESQNPGVRYDAAEVEFAEQSVGDEYLADEDPATELAVEDYPVDEWTYDETTASESIVDRYILVYGDGLHPVQWFSSMFLHGDILHLLGNMFFLWGFGLVVEGKLGWWKFLVAYLAMGVLQSAAEQLVMLGYDGGVPGSLGASAAIFAVLAMAWVWAPKNEMSCILMLGFRFARVEVSILGFGAFYFCWELLMALLGGFAVSSAMLHLSGALLGLALGITLLKTGHVDCEGWDVFTLWRGEHGAWKLIDKEVEQLSPEEEEKRSRSKRQTSLAAIQQFLSDGNCDAALAVYRRTVDKEGAFSLGQQDLVALIKQLVAKKNWSAVVPLMLDHVRRFPQKSLRMRLNLAQLLIQHERRPARALELLAEIPAGSLPKEAESICRRLVAKARQMQEEGELELEGDDV